MATCWSQDFLTWQQTTKVQTVIAPGHDIGSEISRAVRNPKSRSRCAQSQERSQRWGHTAWRLPAKCTIQCSNMWHAVLVLGLSARAIAMREPKRARSARVVLVQYFFVFNIYYKYIFYIYICTGVFIFMGVKQWSVQERGQRTMLEAP